MIDGSPASREISLGSEVCLRDSVTATQLCRHFIISMRTASASAATAAQTPVDCSELHQQPIDAVLRPTFVHKLCYKLSSVVTFSFLQTFWLKFCLLYWSASKLPRLIDSVSKFALFSVFDLKDEKLIKKQTYMKTESCKLYSRDFWIFLPNNIKIDRYNFWAIPFQSWAVFWDTVYYVSFTCWLAGLCAGKELNSCQRKSKCIASNIVYDTVI